MTKQLNIKDVQITDDAHADIKTGLFSPASISVFVEIEYKNECYYLDFQSSMTHDYGAYSPTLAAYDGSDDYDRLQVNVANENRFINLLNRIKLESNAQLIYDEYMKLTYVVNDDYFSGLDANSCINSARAI